MIYSEELYSYTIILLPVFILPIASYTIYIIRNNMDVVSRLNFTQFILSIFNTPIIIVFLFLTMFANMFLRYNIFSNINFHFTIDYFTLYYLIVFTLLPISASISNIISIYLRLSVDFNFKSINMYSLNVMFIICFIVFVTKGFVFLPFLGSGIYLVSCLRFCSLSTLPVNTGILIRSTFTSNQLVIGTAVGGIGMIDVITENNIEDFTPSSHPNFHVLNDTNIVVRNTINLDTDNRFFKNLNKLFKDRDLDARTSAYLRVADNKVISLSNLKGAMTRSLGKNGDLSINNLDNLDTTRYVNVPYFYTSMDDAEFIRELNDSYIYPTLECHTYGFITNLLVDEFRMKNKEFTIVPQSGSVDGAVDFLLKKKGNIHAIIESKSLKGKYSLTELYFQAIEYANTNHDTTDVYVIINKGPYISFGLYSSDFHSANASKFHNKFHLFDGYVGLETDNNFRVKPVAQYDTVNVQHKLYKLNDDPEDRNQLIACSAILSHIRLNNPDISKLD